MDILNSLYTSVFGMSVVFAALVILIVLITLQSYLFATVARRRVVKAFPAPLAAEPAAIAVQPGLPSAPPELKLIGVDDKTAAMIMAIVCETNRCEPNELYFKSIRALDEIQGSIGEGV